MNPAESSNPKGIIRPNQDDQGDTSAPGGNGELSEQANIAGQINNQAVANHHQGKYSEAERLYLRAIASFETGERGDQLALSLGLNNLSALYYQQEKYIRAEPLCKRSLAIREKALGPDHPDVADSLILYAKLLRKKKFNYKAAQLEVRAKNIKKSNTNKTNPT